jgi:hypothetical protein
VIGRINNCPPLFKSHGPHITAEITSFRIIDAFYHDNSFIFIYTYALLFSPELAPRPPFCCPRRFPYTFAYLTHRAFVIVPATLEHLDLPAFAGV